MDEETARRIAQLQAAFDQGILDEDAFRTFLANLDPDGAYSATAERSNVAHGPGSMAVGERAAKANDVDGSIVTGDNNSVTNITTIYQQAHGTVY